MSRRQPGPQPEQARRNVAASVRQRLLNLTPSGSEEFQVMLTRYGIERLLYRMSQSSAHQDFILKGAVLFTVWYGAPHRRTRDADLLGRGSNDPAHLVAVFTDICGVPVIDDGLIFHPDTIHVTSLNAGEEYEGVRVTLTATLDGARIPLQVDVGFGDAISPPPQAVTIPSLLDFPAPTLLAYPPETVVAEKFHAMVEHGIANTRLKDYYDVWVLLTRHPFDDAALAGALHATFARRRTPLPTVAPIGLTEEYADDKHVQGLWTAFVRRAKIQEDIPELPAIVEQLRGRFMTLCGMASRISDT